MAIFAYKARNPAGGIVTGIIEAEGERAVILRLRGQHLTPITITERKPSAFGKALA